VSTLAIIVLAVIIGVIVFFSAIVVVAFVRSRRLAKLSPPPPFKCPACGSEQIERVSSGLSNAIDLKGRGTIGTRDIGTCKSCGTHCVHFSVWDNDKKESLYETGQLTDEEWQRLTEPTMKVRKQQAEWPFITEWKSRK
jgi:transcription elongation factor Elf1